MNKSIQQTGVVVATKTKTRIGFTSKVAVSLGVLGATAAFAAAMAPGAMDDGGSLFSRRALVKVSVAGNGNVTSVPQGISCPERCEAPFVIGTEVKLIPNDLNRTIFAGWNGGCDGSKECAVKVGNSPVVNAVFQQRLPKVAVSVSVEGVGQVNSNPGGIICGSDCAEEYSQGATVSLTAIPAVGMNFVGWSGACGGATPVCVITASANLAVIARFSAAIGS